MLTKHEFGVALAVLGIGTGETINAKELEIWYQCLQDIPLPTLQSAIMRYLCEGDDWPSIAKIRKLASAATYGECITFGESFEQMLAAVRKHGFCNAQAARESLDNLTWRTIQGLGGWEAVCDSQTGQRATLRAQFRMAYESLREREERHRSLPEAVHPRIENPAQRKVDRAVHPSVSLPELRSVH